LDKTGCHTPTTVAGSNGEMIDHAATAIVTAEDGADDGGTIKGDP